MTTNDIRTCPECEAPMRPLPVTGCDVCDWEPWGPDDEAPISFEESTMTHRQTFIDQLPTRQFLGGLHRQALIDAARDGIDALATLYFDEYEDEDTLPIDILNIQTFLMDLTGDEAPLVADALNGDTE